MRCRELFGWVFGFGIYLYEKLTSMDTVQISLPKQAQIADFEVKMMVAGGLYEKGRLSAGEAAAVVGLSKRAFLEVLGTYGFSIVGYTVGELEEDLKSFEGWKKL